MDPFYPEGEKLYNDHRDYMEGLLGERMPDWGLLPEEYRVGWQEQADSIAASDREETA